MATRVRTFGLDETFIEPQVLPPPPTRHALLVFLIALAAILHIGTAGWSDIHNGVEGLHAGVAREMLRTETWMPPDKTSPPFLYWLLVGSYKVFGLTAVAAHVPIAVAMVASIALTFLIGERLAGYWRGFAAGLIHLCCLGPFVWGRIVTTEPVLGALMGAAMLCAIRGYQHAKRRQLWFAGVWLCVAFAYLTSGWVGLIYPVAILSILALLFREARIRFLRLLHWQGILIFLAVTLPRHIWMSSKGVSFSSQLTTPLSAGLVGEGGLLLPEFLLRQAIWLCPVILLVLPATVFALRKIIRPHEFDFAAALPLAWMATGFLPLLFVPARQDYLSIGLWSAFALWSACAWERAPNKWQLVGIGLVFLLGATMAISILMNASPLLPMLPVAEWIGFKTVSMLAGGALVLGSGTAAYFAARKQETRALAAIMLTMVPVGLSVAEGSARHGSNLSFANAARLVQPRLGDTGEVLFEGLPEAGSSLAFHLERAPTLVTDAVSLKPLLGIYGQVVDPDAALEKMGAAHPVYLIIHKDRTPYWQERLTERYHIYHHETTCGIYAVVNNQR